MIIEKTENGIYKMLDLSELPKKKWGEGEAINWMQTQNHSIPFSFGEYSGELKITHVGNRLQKITFDNRKLIIAPSNLKSLRFGKIFRQGLTIRKELHRYILNEKDKLLPPMANKTVMCKCDNCGAEQEWRVQSLTLHGFSCKLCSNNVSYPERFVCRYLKVKNIKFETQKVFEGLSHRRFDFYLPELNVIIETHGEQHYTPKFNKKSFLETQISDSEKRKFSRSNNIYLIELDCRKSEPNWIARQINNHDVLPCLNDREITFVAQGIAQGENYNINEMKKMYREGDSIKDIALKHNVCAATVSSIFRRVNFNSYLNRETRRQVVCQTTGLIYKNRLSAANHMKMKTSTNITTHLNRKDRTQRPHSAGKHPTTGEPLKWMYYEDYIEKYGTEGLTEYVEDKRELL